MGSAVTVLHVFGRMNRGGAETRTVEVMRLIDRQRFRLIYCALSGKAGSFDQEIRDLGGEVFPCRLGVSFPLKFIRLLRRERVEVVHSHVLLSSGFVLFLARVARVPVRVAHFRSEGDGRVGTPRRRLQRAAMRRLVDRYATQIIAVTEATMHAVWGSRADADPRCQVIPNGVSTTHSIEVTESPPDRTRYRVAPDGLLVSHVGRSLPEKNRSRAVKIFSALIESGVPCSLALAGGMESDERATLQALATDHGVDDRIAYLGELEDVPYLLAASDLLLAPSLREGLPGVVLEACAVGTPVLASDVRGMLEVASVLPLVHCLNLAEDDEKWAASASRLLEVRPTASDRVEAARVFQDGPYTIGRAVESLCAIWSMARADMEGGKS